MRLPPPRKSKRPVYLVARGPHLWLGEQEFRAIGANIPDLFERYLNGADASARASLVDARNTGIRVVRCWGTTWASQGFARYEQDRAGWMAAFARMLADADANGIAIVPSLLFNADMLPDYVRRTTGKDEQAVEFLTPGSRSNSLAVEYVTAMVTRFRDDPRILFWEIGNEYNLLADLSKQWKARPNSQIPTSDQVVAFLAQIARLVHSLDKHHLVTSGNADMRPYAWHIRQAMLAHRSATDPLDYPMDWTKDTLPQYIQMLQFFNPAPLSVISVHQYPPGADFAFWLEQDDTHAYMLPWTRYAADQIGLPLFVGEFGEKVFADGKEQPAAWTLDFLRRLADQSAPSADFGAPVAAIWAWEFDLGAADGAPYSLAPGRTPRLDAAILAADQIMLTGMFGAASSPVTAPARAPRRASKPPPARP